MNDFGYINGSKVTVKLNGTAVGGIISAVIKRKNNLINIGEFLTDKPVYSQTMPSYSIELRSRTDIASLLDGSDFFSLTFEDEEKTVEYTDCSLDSSDESVVPGKPSEYRAVISAKDRSVADV